MPWINGRYYMNPAYGRALEKARVKSEGGVWTEEDSRPVRQAVSDVDFWDDAPLIAREPVQEVDFWEDEQPSRRKPIQDDGFWDDEPSSGVQQQDSNARWMTINGRHVLIHEARQT